MSRESPALAPPGDERRSKSAEPAFLAVASRDSPPVPLSDGALAEPLAEDGFIGLVGISIGSSTTFCLLGGFEEGFLEAGRVSEKPLGFFDDGDDDGGDDDDLAS